MTGEQRKAGCTNCHSLTLAPVAKKMAMSQFNSFILLGRILEEGLGFSNEAPKQAVWIRYHCWERLSVHPWSSCVVNIVEDPKILPVINLRLIEMAQSP